MTEKIIGKKARIKEEDKLELTLLYESRRGTGGVPIEDVDKEFVVAGVFGCCYFIENENHSYLLNKSRLELI